MLVKAISHARYAELSKPNVRGRAGSGCHSGPRGPALVGASPPVGAHFWEAAAEQGGEGREQRHRSLALSIASSSQLTSPHLASPEFQAQQGQQAQRPSRKPASKQTRHVAQDPTCNTSRPRSTDGRPSRRIRHDRDQPRLVRARQCRAAPRAHPTALRAAFH